MLSGIQFAILITSDRASSGERPDLTIPLLQEMIEEQHGACRETAIISDDFQAIKDTLFAWAEAEEIDVILTSGGTGISTRDVTVDATLDIIEKEFPGFGEEMRRRSVEMTPFAILSRATAGLLGNTMIVNLPGNPTGAGECLGYIMKPLAHAVHLVRKSIQDCTEDHSD